MELVGYEDYEAGRSAFQCRVVHNSDFSFALDSIESDDYRPIVEYHFKETYKDIPIYGTDITLVKLIDGIYVECLTYANNYNNNIKLTKNMFNMQLPDGDMDNIIDSNEIKQKFLGEYNLTEDDITFNGLCYKCNKNKNEDTYIATLCYYIVDNIDHNNYLIAASTGEVLCCIPSDIN